MAKRWGAESADCFSKWVLHDGPGMSYNAAQNILGRFPLLWHLDLSSGDLPILSIIFEMFLTIDWIPLVKLIGHDLEKHICRVSLSAVFCCGLCSGPVLIGLDRQFLQSLVSSDLQRRAARCDVVAITTQHNYGAHWNTRKDRGKPNTCQFLYKKKIGLNSS